MGVQEFQGGGVKLFREIENFLAGFEIFSRGG